MENIMITGSGGMVGSHMIDMLSGEYNIIGTYYKPTVNINEVMGKAQLFECDVRYFLDLYRKIEKYRPQKIFHLAAQSYPTVSWQRAEETIDTNAVGTINVFEAVKKIRETGLNYDPMVVVACSSAEYGDSLLNCEEPITESAELLPLHPYGVSKVCQDLLAYQYFRNNGIRCIRARIFNTTGPRKTNDVCSDFTKRVVLMEKGIDEGNQLKVGNLNTKRAITDVRDLVRALTLLADKGKAGEVYNISGQYVYEINEIVDIIKSYTDLQFEVAVEPSLLRSTDEKVICGNSEKLMHDTGWKQTYKLEQTIKDMMDYWREVL